MMREPTIEEINDAFWDAQPLGELGDRKLANQLRVPPSRVRLERKKRGIPACHPPPKIEITNEETP